MSPSSAWITCCRFAGSCSSTLTAASTSECPCKTRGPWIETLAQLLADPAEYDRVARESAEAAAAFVGGLSWQPFVDYMRALDARQ